MIYLNDLMNFLMNCMILMMNEGDFINPWSCKKWYEFYSSAQSVRSSLRMHYCKGIDDRLKIVFNDFSKWLRKKYVFPIRVSVYIKNSFYIKAMDGENVSATFLGPFDRLAEPYIKIAVGDYYDLVEKYNEFNALCSSIASLAHELTHYYQWLNDVVLSENQEERQANYYARKIVQTYLDEQGYDFLEQVIESQ